MCPEATKNINNILPMTDQTANKDYISKQIEIAKNTDSEAIKNDALYRAGTQMEVIECDGNSATFLFSSLYISGKRGTISDWL